MTANEKKQGELRMAMELHRSGAFKEAAEIYKVLLRSDPKNFDLNHMLGIALLQTGQTDLAVSRLQMSLRINPASVAALSNLGVAYLTQGRSSDAIASFDKAIALRPELPDPYARKAAVYQAGGAPEKAAAAFEEALARKGADPALLNDYGASLRDLKRYDEAVASFDKAIALQPDHVPAMVNKGNTLRDMKKPQEALIEYERALALHPGQKEAMIGKAWALEETRDDAGALAMVQARIAQDPMDGGAYLQCAGILRRMKRYEEAIEAYTMATHHRPNDPDVYLNWASFLAELERYDGALSAYDRALELSAENAAALYGRANALRGMDRLEEAQAVFDRARAIAPDMAGASPAQSDNAVAYYGRAESLRNLNRIDAALIEYARAFALDPDMPTLQGVRLHVMMQLCDWSAFDTVEDMLEKLRNGKVTAQPFPLVALPATAEDQMICAQFYAREKYPLLAPVWKGEKYAHDKIRVAYLSADFHRHATAYLMAGLFEEHDRKDFEWTALSSGQDDKTPMRARLEAAFDHFIDIRGMNDEAVSRLIREKEIDILVDLKGYTQNTRFEILTRRCAPVQLTYIGYPGTTASAAVDYAMADVRVIPPEMEPYFTEKIIYLPNSYQVNDRKREISTDIPGRGALGLPENAFVFCSFNHNYKITPDTFDVWMRILQHTPNSVLWLFKANDTAAKNLRAEAEKRGVDPDRLIFAAHMKLEDHLARLKQADLFLDNLPCNAHTTASDALWSGLPVLTCPGGTFAGRVATSLLTAIDMPEMVMPTMQAYKEKAVELGTSPEKMQAVKDKLAANRLTTPLFDTQLSARHIEAAYREIHRRFHAGEQVEHVYVQK